MSIKKELAKGVFWIALAKYSGIFISLGITAILARNISPSAFGTMAIATVIMAFLDIFSDMGLGVAVVQFKDLDRFQFRSLFTLSIGIAIILTSSLYFLSDVVAQFYDDKVLKTIMRWLCICLFFNSLNIIPNGLMLRAKRFRAIATRTLSFQIISGGGACIAALNGWGIYALLITPIVTSIGVFTFNIYNYPLNPAWPINVEVVRKVWSYSVFQLLFNFINYFSRNSDKLIIGKFLSMQDLGYYEKSYRLMQMPLQNITFVITPVLHPVLSSLQNNPNELFNKNVRLTKILSQISFPLGIILYFCSAPIILIVFGKNWIPAIPVFEILSISVPLQLILSTSGSIYQAAGQTKHMFYCGLQSAACTVGSFILAAFYFRTMEAIAWAWDISLFINFFFCYWLMNRITFHTHALCFFKVFLPQLLNSAITIGIISLTNNIWKPNEAFLLILWNCGIIGVTSVIMGAILHQYSPKEMIRFIFSRK